MGRQLAVMHRELWAGQSIGHYRRISNVVNKSSNYGTLKRQQYLSLTDIAYNVLVEAIINQELKPGAPISIDNLAAQLNMSNTPIREALMRAHGERLVTQKTNRGFL